VADAVEHGKTVLAAIFAGRGQQNTAVLDLAVTRLTPEHFPDTVQRTLFVLAQRYADQTRGILPRAALADVFRDAAPGQLQLYGEYYDALCQRGAVLGPDLAWAIGQLRELYDERATGEALARGMEVLRSGIEDERGTFVKGHQAARQYVLSAFAEVEQRHSGAAAPAGDVRAEPQAIWERYAKAKEQRVQGRVPGVAFGIPELDRRLPAGVLPGSLNVVLGWTSSGKTSFCVQWAWHAAVMQGRDVVYFTTETLRPEVTARLLARHSRLEKFGLPQGLDSMQILAGNLDPPQEGMLARVIQDFTSGPYGSLNVIQTPRAATIGTIEARLAAIGRRYRPAICFMDYLQLLDPERSRRDSRQHEDLSGIVKEAGQVAATFSDGAGIPFVSPWQVTREGRKEALKTGGYSLLDTGGTKEASDSADLVLALMDPEKYENPRDVEIKATVLKNRSGPRNFTASLSADFTTCVFSSAARTTASSDVMNMGA
jgi:replicative DNA helicase